MGPSERRWYKSRVGTLGDEEDWAIRMEEDKIDRMPLKEAWKYVEKKYGAEPGSGITPE
jgi:hypothetical protein